MPLISIDSELTEHSLVLLGKFLKSQPQRVTEEGLLKQSYWNLTSRGVPEFDALILVAVMFNLSLTICATEQVSLSRVLFEFERVTLSPDTLLDWTNDNN